MSNYLNLVIQYIRTKYVQCVMMKKLTKQKDIKNYTQQYNNYLLKVRKETHFN